MKNSTQKEKLNEIRKLYPKLKNYGFVWAMGIYQKICEDQLITEFEGKTMGIDKTIRYLISRYKDKLYNIQLHDDIYSKELDLIGDEYIFITFINDQISNIPEINKFMDSFGWYPSLINDIQYTDTSLDQMLNSKVNKIHIVYEASFDMQIDVSNQKYLYHLTPNIHIPKIELLGLTPKTKSKLSTHPGRIYLLSIKNNLTNQLIDISKMLYAALPKESKARIKSYHVLRIKTSDLIDYDIYKDPNFEGGVWLYQNIPPAYIEGIQTILI